MLIPCDGAAVRADASLGMAIERSTRDDALSIACCPNLSFKFQI